MSAPEEPSAGRGEERGDALGLAAEIRRRIGPPGEASEWPLVSIVVVNRDGAPLLRRLLRGLVECTDYRRLELILVDNASSDDSLAFARCVEAPFPISILANPHNESFSDACNQGAEEARGELLLFLNNDVEPFEPGWLRELVSCLGSSEAGAVAATLLCPDDEHERRFPHGYGVQHRGLELREEADGMIHPVLSGWEGDPLDERLGVDLEPPAVAAACLLVEKRAYADVGGFSHGYVYGAEDVDLSLKLRAAGRRVICSGRALAIHRPASTRRQAPFAEERARKLANRRILWERWGPRLRREYEAAQAPAGTDAASSSPPSYCLIAPGGAGRDSGDDGSARLLAALCEALEDSGRAWLALGGEDRDDPRALNYDIAVYLGGSARHTPKPGQLSVLWWVGESDAPSATERSRYDLVLAMNDSSPAELARSSIAAIEARVRHKIRM